MKRSDREAWLTKRAGGSMEDTYLCATCGERVASLAAARKHATQGYRTQREAFASGALHSLERMAQR